jgi:sialic acid synthase SpsE
MQRTGPDIVCSMDEQTTRDLIGNLMKFGRCEGKKHPRRAGYHRFLPLQRFAPLTILKKGAVYQRKYLGQTTWNRWSFSGVLQ